MSAQDSKSPPKVLEEQEPQSILHRRVKTVQDVAAMPYINAAHTASTRFSPESHIKSLQKFWVSNPHEEVANDSTLSWHLSLPSELPYQPYLP